MNERHQRAISPVQFAKRAAERAAATVHGEMGRGLNGLATVATIAPWVGLFGTVVGINASFIGCGGEKSACMAVFAERLSWSIWPTALGLGVGLSSLWFYRCLAGRLKTFDREMSNAKLELTNQLSLHVGQG